MALLPCVLVDLNFEGQISPDGVLVLRVIPFWWSHFLFSGYSSENFKCRLGQLYEFLHHASILE